MPVRKEDLDDSRPPPRSFLDHMQPGMYYTLYEITNLIYPDFPPTQEQVNASMQGKDMGTSFILSMSNTAKLAHAQAVIVARLLKGDLVEGRKNGVSYYAKP